MVREHIVRQLTSAALDGMATAAVGTTGAEVTCACMSVALRAILSAKDMGADLEQFRSSVERLYAELPPLKNVN